MPLSYRLEDMPVFHQASVVTFGVFDGLHLGHQAVIQRVVKEAAIHDLSTTVLIFYPHPRTFLAPKKCPPILTSCEKRLELLEGLGVDMVLFVRFDGQLAGLSPEVFVQKVLLRQLCARNVIVGYACQFGANRAGNSGVLKSLGVKHNFSVTIVPPTQVHGLPVHSTRVREAVLAGDLALVEQLLGRCYSLIGEIVPGDGRGRELGFPTANITAANQLRPPEGVYVIQAKLEGRVYGGVLNMGVRPTLDGTKFQIESHLFDFEEIVYGKTIEIFFVKRIRGERKFSSVQALVRQIECDVRVAEEFLKRDELRGGP